jgi:TonB-linked SusC/RagA family outer membrane protein
MEVTKPTSISSITVNFSLMKIKNQFYLFKKRFKNAAQLLAFLALAIIVQPTYASVSIQNTRVKIVEKNISLADLIWKIDSQTEYEFVYTSDELEGYHFSSVNEEGELNDILDELLEGKNLSYSLQEGVYIIKKVAPKPAKKEEAQKKKIQGTVTDDQGIPLPGVSVVIKGTNTGVATNIDGEYTLELENENVVLIFSFVGMNQQEIAYTGQEVLNVALTTDSEGLEEVVVVGYGTQKRERIGASIAQVDAEELEERAAGAVSFEQILGGQIKGVQISQLSGKPGAESNIRVRGITSPFSSGNNQPLYVIDGVVFNTDAQASLGGADYSVSAENPLLSINPADIESLSVLKDAGATAIYGSRGANGVIIINTKKGKRNEKANFSLNYSYSFANPTKTLDVLDAKGFKELHKMIAQNTKDAFAQGFAGYSAYQTANAILGTDGELNPNLFGNADTDWQEEINNANAATHQLNFNVSGGTEKSRYSFSINHTDQEGMVINDELKRYGARLSIDSEVKEWLKLGTSLSYNHTNNFSGEASFSMNGTSGTAALARPDYGVYDETGEYQPVPYYFNAWMGGFFYNTPNPVMNTMNRNLSKAHMFNGNTYVEINPFKDLVIKTDLSVGDYKTLVEKFNPSMNEYNLIGADLMPSTVGNGLNETTNIIANIQATYNKTIKNKHHFNLMAGYSFDRSYYHAEYQEYEGTLDSEVLINPASANNFKRAAGGKSESGINSFYSRLQYSFGGLYTATFNFRSDRSSKFGPENQTAYFPSVALSWNAANEKFMSEFDFINELKVRGSYGETGSANVTDFSYLQYFSVSQIGYGGHATLLHEQVFPNREIKWEKTREYNLGVDFALFDSRIRGSFDVYDKYTDGILTPTPIYLESGAASFTSNLAEVSNKGFEIELNGDIIRKKDFTWSLNLNIASNKNKVEDMEGNGLNAYFMDGFIQGEPIGTIRGYKVEKIIQDASEIQALNAAAPDGVYQTNATGPGDYLYKDTNGDGKITSDDREILGSMQPDFFGGFSTTLSYKNLSFGAYFQYSVGNEKVWSNHRNMVGLPGVLNNMGKEALTDTWTPTNTDAKYSRLIYDNYFNTYTNEVNVQDASYLRLKVLRLNYELSGAVMKKLPIDRASFYVSASNLWTLTNYEGLDPEGGSGAGVYAPTGGMSGADIYPFAKTVTLGVSLNF